LSRGCPERSEGRRVGAPLTESSRSDTMPSAREPPSYPCASGARRRRSSAGECRASSASVIVHLIGETVASGRQRRPTDSMSWRIALTSGSPGNLLISPDGLAAAPAGGGSTPPTRRRAQRRGGVGTQGRSCGQPSGASPDRGSWRRAPVDQRM